jgi:hypothetical protein
VLDEPGSGGACHQYRIYCGNRTKTNFCEIHFQKGSVHDHGVNGISQESLLAILIDRMKAYQTGPFPSREGAIALTHIETALLWLQKRTHDRIARGVEGKEVK